MPNDFHHHINVLYTYSDGKLDNYLIHGPLEKVQTEAARMLKSVINPQYSGFARVNSITVTPIHPMEVRDVSDAPNQ